MLDAIKLIDDNSATATVRNTQCSLS